MNYHRKQIMRYGSPASHLPSKPKKNRWRCCFCLCSTLCPRFRFARKQLGFEGSTLVVFIKFLTCALKYCDNVASSIYCMDTPGVKASPTALSDGGQQDDTQDRYIVEALDDYIVPEYVYDEALDGDDQKMNGGSGIDPTLQIKARNPKESS